MKEKSKVFRVLLVLTAIYLAFGVWLVISSKPCDPSKTGYFDQFVACRDVNELGDALAGLFAPLAFLWLAGAVQMQSRELALQRKELELSREEAKLTRDVLAEQAKESRASTAFIGEQTEIIRKQQTLREQEQADEHFDQLIKNFDHAVKRETLTIFATERGVQALDEPGESNGRSFRFVAVGSAHDDGDGAFSAFRLKLLSAMANLKGENDDKYEFTGWDSEAWEGMQVLLNSLKGLEEKLSPPHRAKAKPMLLEETAAKTHQLRGLCRELDNDMAQRALDGSA